MMTLSELCTAAYNNARDKGFHDAPRSIGDECALLHSEISEILEAARDFKEPTEIDFGHEDKPLGIPIECADVLIRLADFCGSRGIDLNAAVETKMAYNRSRPRLHGRKF